MFFGCRKEWYSRAFSHRNELVETVSSLQNRLSELEKGYVAPVQLVELTLDDVTTSTIHDDVTDVKSTSRSNKPCVDINHHISNHNQIIEQRDVPVLKNIRKETHDPNSQCISETYSDVKTSRKTWAVAEQQDLSKSSVGSKPSETTTHSFACVNNGDVTSSTSTSAKNANDVVTLTNKIAQCLKTNLTSFSPGAKYSTKKLSANDTSATRLACENSESNSSDTTEERTDTQLLGTSCPHSELKSPLTMIGEHGWVCDVTT